MGVQAAPGPKALRSPCHLAGLTKLAGVEGSPADVDRAMAELIPLGHVGAKWDIAMACVYLASPAARFVSGEPPTWHRQMGRVSRSQPCG